MAGWGDDDLELDAILDQAIIESDKKEEEEPTQSNDNIEFTKTFMAGWDDADLDLVPESSLITEEISSKWLEDNLPIPEASLESEKAVPDIRTDEKIAMGWLDDDLEITEASLEEPAQPTEEDKPVVKVASGWLDDDFEISEHDLEESLPVKLPTEKPEGTSVTLPSTGWADGELDLEIEDKESYKVGLNESIQLPHMEDMVSKTQVDAPSNTGWSDEPLDSLEIDAMDHLEIPSRYNDTKDKDAEIEPVSAGVTTEGDAVITAVETSVDPIVSTDLNEQINTETIGVVTESFNFKTETGHATREPVMKIEGGWSDEELEIDEELSEGSRETLDERENTFIPSEVNEESYKKHLYEGENSTRSEVPASETEEPQAKFEEHTLPTEKPTLPVSTLAEPDSRPKTIEEIFDPKVCNIDHQITPLPLEELNVIEEPETASKVSVSVYDASKVDDLEKHSAPSVVINSGWAEDDIDVSDDIEITGNFPSLQTFEAEIDASESHAVEANHSSSISLPIGTDENGETLKPVTDYVEELEEQSESVSLPKRLSPFPSRSLYDDFPTMETAPELPLVSKYSQDLGPIEREALQGDWNEDEFDVDQLNGLAPSSAAVPVDTKAEALTVTSEDFGGVAAPPPSSNVGWDAGDDLEVDLETPEDRGSNGSPSISHLDSRSASEEDEIVSPTQWFSGVLKTIGTDLKSKTVAGLDKLYEVLDSPVEAIEKHETTEEQPRDFKSLFDKIESVSPSNEERVYVASESDEEKEDKEDAQSESGNGGKFKSLFDTIKSPDDHLGRFINLANQTRHKLTPAVTNLASRVKKRITEMPKRRLRTEDLEVELRQLLFREPETMEALELIQIGACKSSIELKRLCRSKGVKSKTLFRSDPTMADLKLHLDSLENWSVLEMQCAVAFPDELKTEITRLLLLAANSSDSVMESYCNLELAPDQISRSLYQSLRLYTYRHLVADFTRTSLELLSCLVDSPVAEEGFSVLLQALCSEFNRMKQLAEQAQADDEDAFPELGREDTVSACKFVGEQLDLRVMTSVLREAYYAFEPIIALKTSF